MKKPYYFKKLKGDSEIFEQHLSIIDLLDAQNQALSADLDAANAVYNFLIDFMGVERAIGEFVTFMPEDSRQEWLKKVRTAIGSE